MAQDIKTGAVMGLLIATVYSLYALVLLAARGTAPFDANGVTPAGVIAAYYGGGLVAGSVVGILRPLLRWRLGATIVGIVAAFGVFAGIGIAKEGYLWHWTIRTWQTSVISSVILGGICSNIIWRSSRSARNWPFASPSNVGGSDSRLTKQCMVCGRDDSQTDTFACTREARL
jgi:hypothetical protein